MTNKQLAKQLRDIGNLLFDRTFDPNYKLLLDEASDRLESQSEWISVDERLPNEGEDVLAFCYYHEAYQSQVCYLSPVYKERWITSVAGQWVQVAHWTPLPEPPKMKGGADDDT